MTEKTAMKKTTKKTTKLSSGKVKKEKMVDRSAERSAEQLAQELLRKHFESQFAPLETKNDTKKRKRTQPEEAELDGGDDDMRSDYGSSGSSWEETDNEDDSSIDLGDEWFGFTAEKEEDTIPQPVVVDLSKTRLPKPPKLTQKALRELTAVEKTVKAPTAKKKPEADKEEDELEATNLKNDLALQRLLRESHLLTGDNLEATGKNRIKALESRVQSLGGKDITKQKAPMFMAKGIKRAQEEREQKRRKAAKEAGIVLEREEKKKSTKTNRDRGIGAPSIGKFKGGALIINKKEVAAMSGPKKTSSGSKKRRK